MVCASGELAVGAIALVLSTGSFMLASFVTEVCSESVLTPAAADETGESGCVDCCVN